MSRSAVPLFRLPEAGSLTDFQDGAAGAGRQTAPNGSGPGVHDHARRPAGWPMAVSLTGRVVSCGGSQSARDFLFPGRAGSRHRCARVLFGSWVEGPGAGTRGAASLAGEGAGVSGPERGEGLCVGCGPRPSSLPPQAEPPGQRQARPPSPALPAPGFPLPRAPPAPSPRGWEDESASAPPAPPDPPGAEPAREM